MAHRFVQFFGVCGAAAALFSDIFSGHPAFADENDQQKYKVQTGLELGAEFNDNLRLSPTVRRSGFSHEYLPRISAEREGEKLDIELIGSLGIIRYTELFDNRYRALGRTKLKYDLSEQLDLNLSASYARAPASKTEIEDSGLIDENTVRQDILVFPGISFQMAPKTELNVTGSFHDVDIEDAFISSKSISSFKEFGVTAKWSHELERGITIGITGGYNLFAPKDDLRVRTGEFSANMDYPFASNWELKLSAGTSIVVPEAGISESGQIVSDDKDLSFRGRLGLCYDNDRLTSCVSAGRGLNMGSLGDVSRSTYGAFNSSWNLNDTWSASLKTSYRLLADEAGLRMIDQELFSVSPQIEMKANEHFKVRTYYRFYNRDLTLDSQPETDAEQHLVGVTLIVRGDKTF